MTYIKLESVVIEIEKLPIDNTTPEWAIQKACLIDKINSLPSISFEWLIQETIKELEWFNDYETILQIAILKELLAKLPK